MRRCATRTRENATESATRIGPPQKYVQTETLHLMVAAQSVIYHSSPVRMDPSQHAPVTLSAHVRGRPRGARRHPACPGSSARTSSPRTAPGRPRTGTSMMGSVTTTSEKRGLETEDTTGARLMQGTGHSSELGREAKLAR